MPFKKTFCISDETVNSYGFWVRTAGIDLSIAETNLPCFYDHRTWEKPVGHWINLRVEKDKLLADLVIEGASEEEKEIIRKIQNGDIKGASIGADPITWTEDPAMIKKGQTAATLFACSLFEASITPLPGNHNALALKNGASVIALNGSSNTDFIPVLNTNSMKQIALKLGLPEDATEAQITQRIAELQLNASNGLAAIEHVQTEAATELNAEQSALFNDLAKTSLKNALSFLKLSKQPAAQAAADTTEDTAGKGAKVIKKDVTVSSLIEKGKVNLNKPADTETTFDYLQKHNPVELARIRKEEPEQYAALAKAYQQGVRHKG